MMLAFAIGIINQAEEATKLAASQVRLQKALPLPGAPFEDGKVFSRSFVRDLVSLFERRCGMEQRFLAIPQELRDRAVDLRWALGRWQIFQYREEAVADIFEYNCSALLTIFLDEDAVT
jgi:hypothetical protein